MVLLAGLSLAVREASARAPWEGAHTPASTASDLYVWSDFYPVDWVTALPLSAGVLVSSPDGFQVDRTLFRLTVNGGVTWTDWSSSGLNATLLDPTTLQIAVNGVTLPDSQLQNRIQFQVTTTEGQVETSSAYVVRVDTIAPGPPTAMISTPNSWTNLQQLQRVVDQPVRYLRHRGRLLPAELGAALSFGWRLRHDDSFHRGYPRAR